MKKRLKIIVLKNAKSEIESELEKARANINDEIVSVATLMAEKIILSLSSMSGTYGDDMSSIFIGPNPASGGKASAR